MPTTTRYRRRLDARRRAMAALRALDPGPIAPPRPEAELTSMELIMTLPPHPAGPADLDGEPGAPAVVRRRRTGLIAVTGAAAVVLLAGGTAYLATASRSGSVAGTTAGGTARGGLPRITAGSDPGTGAALSAATAPDALAAAMPVSFSIGSGVTGAASSRPVWRFEAPWGDLSRLAVRTAAVFGLTGAAVRQPYAPDSWTVTGPRSAATGPTLTLTSGGLASFSYTSVTAVPTACSGSEAGGSLPPISTTRDAAGRTGGAGAGAVTGSGTAAGPVRVGGGPDLPICGPTPAADGPADPHADQVALRLLARLGADPLVTHLSDTPTGGGYTDVAAGLAEPGLSDVQLYHVSVSAEGAVVAASGPLARLVRVGVYPSLSARAAAARLGDPRWTATPSTVFASPVVSEALPGAGAVGSEQAAGPTGETTAVRPPSVLTTAAPPGPGVRVGPDVAVTPVVVRPRAVLTSASPTYQVYTDAAGRVWLLPSWTYAGTQTWIVPGSDAVHPLFPLNRTVISLDAAYVSFPTAAAQHRPKPSGIGPGTAMPPAPAPAVANAAIAPQPTPTAP